MQMETAKLNQNLNILKDIDEVPMRNSKELQTRFLLSLDTLGQF